MELCARSVCLYYVGQVLSNVKVVDEGEYTCVASNVGGNATFTSTLDVQGINCFYHIYNLQIV